MARSIVHYNTAYGLITGVWTSSIIQDIIYEEFGVLYHDGHVRKLLKKFGFSVQRPKHLLANADKEKKESWMRETYPTLKKKPTKIESVTKFNEMLCKPFSNKGLEILIFRNLIFWGFSSHFLSESFYQRGLQII